MTIFEGFISKIVNFDQKKPINVIFLEFQILICGQIWPIIGRFFCQKIGWGPQSHQIFLSCTNIKIDNFIAKIVNFDQKTTKNAIFLKFQNLICGRNWPIIGRFFDRKVRSGLKSRRNFLSRSNPKIDDFKSKKHTPPKKGLFFFGGGVNY